MNKEEAIEILQDIQITVSSPYDYGDCDANRLQRVINWLKETEQ